MSADLNVVEDFEFVLHRAAEKLRFDDNDYYNEAQKLVNLKLLQHSVNVLNDKEPLDYDLLCPDVQQGATLLHALAVFGLATDIDTKNRWATKIASILGEHVTNCYSEEIDFQIKKYEQWELSGELAARQADNDCTI